MDVVPTRQCPEPSMHAHKQLGKGLDYMVKPVTSLELVLQKPVKK